MQNKKEESNFFRTGTFRRKRNFSVTSLFGSNNSNNKLRMKKKLQIGLISGPLGDVRHTAHVGHSDGDVFGDTTFLQKELNTTNQSQGGSRASTGSSTSSIIQSGIRTGSSTSSIIQSQLSIPQIDGNIATIRRNGKHINKKIKYKRNSAEVIPQKQSAMTSQQPPKDMSPEQVTMSPVKMSPQVIMSPGRHPNADRMSIYEGWKFPDLGSDSLLEEVLKIMDQKTDL